MGCGNSKEKLEDEMIKLKFQRAQIQMERKNQIKILEGIERKKITEPIIPDFISFQKEKPAKKILTETKENKSVNKKEKKSKKEKGEKEDKDNKKRSKSVKTKNKKTESTGPESKKDGKTKITKKDK